MLYSYFRQIIAVLHFNSNLQRDVRAKADGQQQLKVVWPKFKNGEATVRDVRVVPNFGKEILNYPNRR